MLKNSFKFCLIGLCVILFSVMIGCASNTTPLTHEQVLANVNTNLAAANEGIQILSTSVKVLAPVASAIAKESGASSTTINDINTAAKTASIISNTASQLAPALNQIPPNTPVASKIDTPIAVVVPAN